MVEEEKDPKERLRFAYYTRNDAFVKERFVAKDYNRASTTGLGNFDRLFGFFLGLDLFSLFDFRPEGRQRIMIPTVLLLSTYSAKIICEMSSLNQIDTQLFKDRALLEKIGFTGVQIEEGFSERSKKRHLPFNVSTLGKLMPDFSLEEINGLFSRQFALLAQKHVRSQVKVYHRQRSKVYHPPIGLLNRQPSQIFLFGYLFFLCTIFGLAFQAPFGNYLLCDERRSPALSNH